ncbi:septal ring lytic transglycosylase RlpA family protein [Candidatus Peregrinibacteria bacterium]|nr:septal ring lytic transglycosylase RlpA family protein [Candidatus Peregrinibacteria bacterium]
MLWRSISRPAYETRQTEYFADVQPGNPGFLEITWAKNRKILDADEHFYPEDPLRLEDALLWLYRTRNVRDITAMQREHLMDLIRAYPILFPDTPLNQTVFHDRLTSLMADLDTVLTNEVHTVSFYGEDFHGDGTAFGEAFDMNALTAAHRTFPQDTLVKVTNIDNGKSVVVRINDRGPYIDGRDMDLSRAAFESIAPSSRGVLQATFQRLGDTDLVSGCALERRYQRRITKDTRFHRGIPHVLSLGETLWLGANRFFVMDWITYPDGNRQRFQDFVGPKERFTFKPAIPGEYIFIVGTPEGRRRKMRMRVVECS